MYCEELETERQRRTDPRSGRLRVRACCGLCRYYAPHPVVSRHATAPVQYDLRCGRCGWIWRSRAPLNFWVWLKRRYALSSAELRRAQKLAFMRVFGPDESYRVVSFERLRGVGIYGVGIKLQVVKYVESEMRPLRPEEARERRRETLSQLRVLQREMPRWKRIARRSP